MKTIFRSLNIAVLTAAVIALGAVVGFAQEQSPTPANPNCTDSAGQNAARDNITALFAKKDLDSRRQLIDAGKAFLEKYGSCGSAVQDMVDYLKVIPTWEANYQKAKAAAEKQALLARFNTALTSKNWDDVYASGKEILAKYPDEFRDVELVFGTIGYDELYNNKNSKYNDDTLRYAKMSLADIDAGRFKTYGIPKTAFDYKTADEAKGWMNLIIGYITQTGQKDKKGAQPYLYAATQAKSTAANQPIPFELIGNYYFDERDKIAQEITTLAASQSDTDTPEVAKQKVADIEAKVALANGYAERAMDAFARAYTLGVAKAYKDLMYKNLEAAFKARYGKTDALTQAWIADAVKKPVPNPTTPVTPIADPKPVTTTTTGTTTPPTGTPVTTPVNNTTKPTTPAKPAPKPAGTAPAKPTNKRQASVKKPAAKKKA